MAGAPRPLGTVSKVGAWRLMVCAEYSRTRPAFSKRGNTCQRLILVGGIIDPAVWYHWHANVDGHRNRF